MIELERKVWLHHPKKLLKKLHIYAEYVKKEKKKDFYYTQKDFFKIYLKKSPYAFSNLKDFPIFRVRSFDNFIQMNYKKKKYFKNEEYNLEKESHLIKRENWIFYKDFFNYLKFFCFIKKIKQTVVFHYKNFRLEYNKIENLGFFLEIEYLIHQNKETTFNLNQKLLEMKKIFDFFNLKKFENRLYIDLLLEKKFKKKLL